MRCRVLFAVCILVIGSFAAVGCDEEESTDQQDDQADEQLDDEAAELAEQPDQQQMDYEEPEFDEDMFILAAFETRCVDQEIDDEDQAAEIHDEIHARYGFGDGEFDKAAEHFEADETVELHIETRMERCDEELALQFAEKGAGDMDDAEEAEQEARREVAEQTADEGDEYPEDLPQPPITGELTDELEADGLEDTTLTLRIRSSFQVGGEVRGEYDGSGFLIPISGEISEGDYRIDADGQRGEYRVEITGSLDDEGASGNLFGEVDGDSFETRFDTRF